MFRLSTEYFPMLSTIPPSRGVNWTGLPVAVAATKGEKKMPRAVYPTSSPVSLILLSNEKLSSAFRAAWKKREGRRELIFTRLVI